MEESLTALVLAGTRPGGDPLARACGVSHKALLEVGGRTLLERVVDAVGAAAGIGRIVVAGEAGVIVDGLRARGAGHVLQRIEVVAPAEGPSATVGAVLAREGAPLLVTTVDHALLEGAWIEALVAGCPDEADVAAALAPRAAVERAAPHSRRTWLRFADGDYSGCNLFLLRTPRAAGAVAFWARVERDRKRPLRLLAHLGWRFAWRYARRRLTADAAAARLGELSGARVAFVTLPEGRAAIDVDSVDDLALVRRLAGPQCGAPSPSSRQPAASVRAASRSAG